MSGQSFNNEQKLLRREFKSIESLSDKKLLSYTQNEEQYNWPAEYVSAPI
jgi:hypothetical protein